MFKLQIFTPHGSFYQGEVSILTAKSVCGYVSILVNHAPLLTPLDTAPLTFIDENEQKQICACSEGLLFVDHNKVTLLVEAIEFQADIDIARAKEALAKARAMKKDPKLQKLGTIHYKRALNRLKVAKTDK